MGDMQDAAHGQEAPQRKFIEAIDLQHMVRTTTIALVIILRRRPCVTTVFSVMLPRARCCRQHDGFHDPRHRAVRAAPAHRYARAGGRELRTSAADHCRKYNITKRTCSGGEFSLAGTAR